MSWDLIGTIGNDHRTIGALEIALTPERHGIAMSGGKGKTSTKAPTDVRRLSETFSLSAEKVAELVRASRMSAKVDNALVQDRYQLYHHAFFFTEKGEWAVVQQGMKILMPDAIIGYPTG